MQDKKSSSERAKRSSNIKATSGLKKRDRKSRTSRSAKPKVSAKPIKSEPIDVEPYNQTSKTEFKNELIKRLSNAVGVISRLTLVTFWSPTMFCHQNGRPTLRSIDKIWNHKKVTSKEKWRKTSHQIKLFKVNVVLGEDNHTEKSQMGRRKIWKSFGKILRKMKGEITVTIPVAFFDHNF